MKNYNLISQEKNNYCLCSVLQAILSKYDIKFSQKEIAENLTPAEKGFRIDDKNIKNFMKKLGFDYEFYWHNEIPFNEPDMLLKEMQKENGIIGIKSHVYLMYNFKDPFLILGDPKKGYVGTSDIFRIIKKMEKKGGFFGLIKKLD